VAPSNLATEQRDALVVTTDQLQLNAQRESMALGDNPPLLLAIKKFSDHLFWQVLTGEFAVSKCVTGWC
jgi:hypothetical protein